MPINGNFRRTFSFLRKTFFELNLFNNGSQDEFVIRNQRRSTRLYLFLLITSLLFIGTYYSIITKSETVIMKSPSFEQYSSISTETSLQCFCRKIAIKYKEFIQIVPYYHELCTSDLISDDFITELYNTYVETWINSTQSDFYNIAAFQFNTLRRLCELTRETIENNLEIFLQTEFIHSQLIAQESLQIQISSLLSDFIQSISKAFLRTLTFIQNITAQNLFMTGGSVTSVSPTLKTDDYEENPIGYQGITYHFLDNSSCTCSSSTSTICMGLTTIENETLSGFQTGCYMFSALLKSTLEVFYDQTFIDELTNSSINFQKLNSSVSNQTIEQLLGEMLTRQWKKETFFDRYYSQCSPDTCQYTITKRNDFLFILTSLIGLFGGLSSAYLIIAPLVVNKFWAIMLTLQKRKKPATTPWIHTANNPTSIPGRLRNIIRTIKQLMVKLNLFNSIPPSEDQDIVRQQRIITWIYLILLTSSMIIIITYSSIQPHTVHFTKNSPSSKDFIELYAKYPLTLSCSCSNSAIDLYFLAKLVPEYHEICSSQFVSSDWINLQFIRSESEMLSTSDIRSHFEYFFQIISTLCQMSMQTIEDSLQSLYRTKFITTQALDVQSFEMQINLIIEQFQRTTPESFQRILNLLKTTFDINQFIVPTNSLFQIDIVSFARIFLIPNGFLWKRPVNNSLPSNVTYTKEKCFSTSSIECYQNIFLYENETQFTIPGMYQSWFPLHSILMSTLECLYDEICFGKIKRITNSTSIILKNISILKSSNNQYDQIDSLANKLFIQSWINESYFGSYYNQCNPLMCQYTIETRLSLIYIITTIIGLVGGINLVLRISIPFLFRIVKQIRNSFIHRKETFSTRRKFFHHFSSITKQNFLELNLFSTIPPSKDPKILRRNRHLTRIYIILLFSSFVILILYGLLRQETILVIVESPSVSKYQQLADEYPLTLKCPCSRTSIKYNKLISQLEPQFHDVCSSIFVSSEWLKKIDSRKRALASTFFHFLIDYRYFLFIQFQSLTKLCTLSRSTVNTSLTLFQQNDFVTSNVISSDEFLIRTKAILEQFKKTIAIQFIETINLIQLTYHGNQLANIFSSNWQFYVKYTLSDLRPMLNHTVDVLAEPKVYSDTGCSCQIYSNCSVVSYIILLIYSFSDNPRMPGFRIGCFFFDALLQSSLACLYDKLCLGQMQSYIDYSKPIKTNVLSYSSLTPPNTTIETLLNQLFVSQWIYNASFDLYFQECAPQSCVYSYTLQHNIVYIVTLLIAVFGGLTNGLHFLLFYANVILVKLTDGRKQNSVVPDLQQIGETVNNENMNTITTTSVNDTSGIREHTSRKKYFKRIIPIGSILLILGTVILIFIFVIRNGNKEEKSVSTSTQSIVINNNASVTETPDTYCHMTLNNQAKFYSTGLNPSSMAVGDFNQDSFSDLAVTNLGSDTLSILLGNQNGTFQRQIVFSTGNESRPKEIKAADFNNDTILDLVVILSATSEIVLFLGVSTNDLFVLPPYVLPIDMNDTIATSIEVSDLNNDGSFDLCITYHADNSTDKNSLSIYLNDGDGYQYYNICSDTDWYIDNVNLMLIADLHHSDDIQLYVSGGENFIFAFHIMNYNDEWTCSYAKSYIAYGNATAAIAGRFNNDTVDDLVILSPQSNILDAYTTVFPWLYVNQIYVTEDKPTSVARINFNNDTIDDVAVLHCNGTLSIFVAESTISLFDQNYLTFVFNITENNECVHSVNVLDLNQDGKDDIIFIDPAANEIRVVLGSSCNEQL
ncbi:unnamed protein product [Adineta ricciae]|uniref:Uncharacterized protein n=1 Tax=Adineta ricciae TaxID=249248 RepID=A0A815EQC6_ADIRI|nr:unnamed protein product [Adineta ricciae]